MSHMYDQAEFYLFEFESNNQDAIEVQTPLIQGVAIQPFLDIVPDFYRVKTNWRINWQTVLRPGADLAVVIS